LQAINFEEKNTPACSYWIKSRRWVVPTIGKHIIAQDALAGGGVGISIDEPSHLGIIITGLDVVERGPSVLRLTARPIFAFSSPTKSRRFCGGIPSNI
jgi:hypothetical protein